MNKYLKEELRLLHKFTLQQTLGGDFDIHITDGGHIICPDPHCIDKEICKHRFLASQSNNRKTYAHVAGVDVPVEEVEAISKLWKNLPWYKRIFI